MGPFSRQDRLTSTTQAKTIRVCLECQPSVCQQTREAQPRAFPGAYEQGSQSNGASPSRDEATLLVSRSSASMVNGFRYFG